MKLNTIHCVRSSTPGPVDPDSRPAGSVLTRTDDRRNANGLLSPLPVLRGRVREGATSVEAMPVEDSGEAPSLTLPRSTGRGDRRRIAARHPFRRTAFTLIEVLVALMLIGIVLPAVGEGISLATRAASGAQHRNEAAGLAEQKLAQILADGTWLNGTTSGDFNPDWPGYTWQATTIAYIGDTSEKNLQQIDLKVMWTARGHADSITLSTLAYDRSQTQ